MRTLHVRLAALVFTLALLLATVGSAWIASRAAVDGEPAMPPSEGELDGRELYQLHCGGCHLEEDLSPALHGPDPGAAIIALLDFLEDHGRSDDRQDRALVAYLIGADR